MNDLLENVVYPKSALKGAPRPTPGLNGRQLVVAIGASAGGLEACQKLLKALPDADDRTYILVQHMEPDHDNLLVDLLATETGMSVREAGSGMDVEAGTVYIIPPGRYLAVGDGVFQVSEPKGHRGVRMPFDFLLGSLAEAYGERCACLVLSGTGSDGSLGLRKIHRKSVV